VRIAIAGGGTGGHTSAGLAVAAILPALAPVELHWIGSRGGVEARRVPEAGIAFHPIPAGKLRRYWDWQNVPDLLLRVPAGLIASRRLLRRLHADLLFATGGFVSLPPAIAARSLGVPVVVHEQTSVPGLANRIVGRLAQRVLLTFPPPAGHVFPPGRVAVTGNPLRPELARGSRAEGLRLLGFRAEAPVVYVTGGAQGAHRINRAVGEALAPLLERAQLVHQCGESAETGDRDWLRRVAEALPPDLRARYTLRPHVGSELAHVYAAADLVVGRSGAGTVNECCQLGLPALFIPLPGTSGDEQTANARLVERAGGAAVLPQASLSAGRLVEAVAELLGDRGRLRAMRERARTLAVPDAAQRIADELLEAAGARRGASVRGRAGDDPVKTSPQLP
jgi:UDP-N-acetylglucosamine--N-acetylmuramyl-(pentapeptide) pyrophosphoryl-undecaprenol N-acetylglucosamine transferase